ncbi:MAG: DUF4013 domain-containing protein [Chloroflexi bacterium]|nr:DUF4013 domain-containing protein [Chloroflexota bacterium]
MDIGKAFTHVLDDPKWIMKVLIGGVVSFIPIVNFAALGYALNTTRNVADSNPTPMPEWSDFGNHFMKGLYGFIGALVYFLPVILLQCCLFVLTLGIGLASGNSRGGDAFAGMLGILSICGNCLTIIFSLFAGITLPAALTRFAMSENQLAVFWDFRGNFDFIKNNVSNYVIALLLGWVAGFVAGFGVILCIVGVVFTYFWSTMVYAHLFGQLWRNSQGAAMQSPAMA